MSQKFQGADEDAVFACADRIKRAIKTEQPAVVMHACLLIMQATHFVSNLTNDKANGRGGV